MSFKRLQISFKHLSFLLFFLASTVAFAQTGGIRGVVVDDLSGEPLVGANAVIKGTSMGTITDVDGSFTIRGIESGSQTLVISYVGYVSQEVSVDVPTSGENDLGNLTLETDAVGLNEVEVIASVAIDRQTPVAVSTIKAAEIEQKAGNQEFPELLRSTPSVYVTKQGGGFGDSRINVRGFDQRNTAVLINGIPVNDMENGWVYWSNWAGLSDVASSMQVQRGLSATRLAVSSVGGTINIITNAAEMKKGGSIQANVGNNGYQKYGFDYSTGLSENGWALTVQGTHTFGNGYADGTKFSGWSYFASITKQFNERNSLLFTVVGAPQWHHQREYGSYDGATIATVQEQGIRYNPQWGNYQGEEFSWRKNFYHKPMAFLNHYWDINDKLELATSAYVSLGRGGGTGDLGQINGSYRTSSKFKNADGSNRFDDIAAWNTGANIADFGDPNTTWTNGGGFDGQYVGTSSNGIIRRASMNEHNWYGVLSNLTYDINERFTFIGGLDARYYKGAHYRRVEDLMGLAAYYDDDNTNNPDHYVTDEGRADGNEIDYYNDGLVNWLGLFGQVEYNYNDLSLFVFATGSNQGFKRVDYFLYEPGEQASDWENFLGGTLKGGANYNINDHHNVFVNGGFFSQQPIFDNVFINYSNEVAADIENQTVSAFELGYGYRGSSFSANLNAYSTTWGNRQISRGIQVDGQDGTANFKGIGQLHQGIELDFTVSPINKLRLNGMASIGNWRYTKNFEASVFNNDRELIGQGTLYTEDVKIPDAAQTTFSLEAQYQVAEKFRAYATYYYADRIYADFNVATDDSFDQPGNQAWQLPSYSLVDLGASYNFPVGNLDCTLLFNINNLLGNEYISEAETNILYDPTIEGGDTEIGNGGSIRNIAYFGLGRTWNAGLRVSF